MQTVTAHISKNAVYGNIQNIQSVKGTIAPQQVIVKAVTKWAEIEGKPDDNALLVQYINELLEELHIEINVDIQELADSVKMLSSELGELQQKLNAQRHVLCTQS